MAVSPTPLWAGMLEYLSELGCWNTSQGWDAGIPLRAGMLEYLSGLGCWNTSQGWDAGIPLRAGMLEYLSGLGCWNTSQGWDAGIPLRAGMLEYFSGLGCWNTSQGWDAGIPLRAGMLEYLSGLGCWNSDNPIPWKELVAVIVLMDCGLYYQWLLTPAVGWVGTLPALDGSLHKHHFQLHLRFPSLDCTRWTVQDQRASLQGQASMSLHKL